MVGIVGKTTIVHPSHLVVLAQPLGNALRILAMTLYTEVQGLEAKVEQEGIHRSLYRAEVAHHLCGSLGDIGHLAETLRKDENLDKLFTPNFTTKSSGTGLGLAICRNIIEKCEGEIRYQRSFVLGGASFIVTIPKRNA